jgi:hypothetical protein
MKARTQARKLVARTHREDLHAAIGIITDPSRDSEDVRLALDKPTEADALDAPANQEAQRVDVGLAHRGTGVKISFLASLGMTIVMFGG